MNEVLDRLREHRITVIYRGLDTDNCLRVTEALYEAGLRSFEVTTNSPEAFGSIGKLAAEFGDRALIGVGTVLAPEEVDRAAEAGARFAISPSTDAEVIARTNRAGLVSIPGAFTPSEVVHASRSGADMVKVFPINAVGADYLAALRGPLDDVEFMATGGVTAQLARDCFAKGATGVGIGTSGFGIQADGSFDQAKLADQVGELLEAAGH